MWCARRRRRTVDDLPNVDEFLWGREGRLCGRSLSSPSDGRRTRENSFLKMQDLGRVITVSLAPQNSLLFLSVSDSWRKSILFIRKRD